MDLIVTHSFTDFDGLAAQLAAHKLYPHAIPLLNVRLNDNVREFEALYHEHLPFVGEDDLPDAPVTQLIVVDTNSPPHLPGLDEETIPTLIIDHHPRSRPPLPHEELIHGEVGATTSLLVERLAASGIALSAVEATLMLLGIYEDTGSLSFDSTRQIDVASAAWLLGQGARIEALGEFLRRPLTPEQEQVYRQLDANIQLKEIGGYTVLLSSAALEDEAPQLSTLAAKLGDLYAPAITALAISSGDAGTQVILRANSDALDAGQVARGFGGGGHHAAAAAFVRERPAGEVLDELETVIRRQLRPAPTAADIMTRHVRSAPPDATVEQADALLARYGHTALPVVDAQQVVRGLITRRDIDKARRHGLLAAPLQRYMWQGPTVIPPDMPIQAIRQALADEEGGRAGRLLVVDEQRRLLGIVTRSDLLRAIDPGSAEPEPETFADELERFLEPTLLGLLHRAAALAEERGSALYIVGGTVRDLLLERPQGDLDLVVEGDAIGLAEALARQLGGAVRSHTQFGTATLELAGHGTLDFVMARTEFYEHPSALPDVEAASLRHDLHRRDFTINTLAVCLNPSRYGRLYDFYGGRRDLERGLIRVLHNLSFIDDPTRILRAARLAARLDFAIEPRTKALIADALEYAVFNRTTPQRIMNELRLVLREPDPERVIGLLGELGVLDALQPGLAWTPRLAELFAAARAAHQGAAMGDLYLGLMVYPLSDEQREALIARYQPPLAMARLIRDLSRLQAALPELRAPALADSVVDRLLHGISDLALQVGNVAEPGPAGTAIQRYRSVLRSTATALDGNALRELGVRPGPGMGALLAELRAAKLDGLVRSREDEEAWVRRQL